MIDDTDSMWEDPRLTQRPVACPSCGSTEVKVIFWGMPAGDPRGPDYVLGGCIAPTTTTRPGPARARRATTRGEG